MTVFRVNAIHTHKRRLTARAGAQHIYLILGCEIKIISNSLVFSQFCRVLLGVDWFYYLFFSSKINFCVPILQLQRYTIIIVYVAEIIRNKNNPFQY